MYIFGLMSYFWKVFVSNSHVSKYEIKTLGNCNVKGEHTKQFMQITNYTVLLL